MNFRLAAAALVSTATLLVTAAPAVAASTVDYVALGDSYAAGVGTPGMTGFCQRSPQGYPQLWADRHQPRSFHNAACGGATTETLLAGQLSALDADTDLVSVSIGGNDAGFAPTVGTCVIAGDDACAA